jgi:hypothetical protein
MNDLSTLIKGSDYFLVGIYAILGYMLMRYFIFRNMNKSFYGILKLFFTLKVFCFLLMCLLTIFYWKEGDAIFYYGEGQNLFQLFKEDLSNIKYLFLPVESYQNRISLDSDLIKTYNGSGTESSFLVSKLCALLYPFSMGRYLLVNFFFCLISAIAQVKLFIILSKRYPHLTGSISLCILFMPTLLLYATPIFKETLCFAFIGFGAFNIYQIIKKEKVTLNIFYLLLNLFLIFLVKPYVLYAMVITVALVSFIGFIIRRMRGSVISKILTSAFVILLMAALLANLSLFDPYILIFTDTSNFLQEQYSNSLGESSSFGIGEMETTFKGLLKKLPIGAYTTYFRPHLWEVRKPIILFSALECFFILCLTIWAFLRNGKYFFKLLREDKFARYVFVYTIILSAIIGLTTFNFGTLIRYKVPGVPFFWLFIFMLFYYTPSLQDKKKVLPGEVVPN